MSMTRADWNVGFLSQKRAPAFASTRPVQIGTELPVIVAKTPVIFASTRPVQIGTYTFRCWLLRLGIFASTRPVQIGTRKAENCGTVC